ncbi:hypothetical protein KIP88_22495 [Bradyrhizobium sp. SRL28]|uniref:hypothetical protein n=1 Tax=Bradyrhizobium sp. SRL28 TaxID=2836178 RepID=UPI001BDED1B1|nr:hypothetical protein [Bradyrhizobium sp. SRL28]MBT1513265.1 hypothetical protein [Bradyrhizobium sp. SRL28]
MTLPPFRVEALAAHDRSRFCCGNDRIDRHFRETVSQDIKRGYVKCFVAVEVETERLAGFYTLTSNSVPLTQIPDELKKKDAALSVRAGGADQLARSSPSALTKRNQ